MHDLAVLRKQARQTRSFPRLGPRRACAVAFERTLRWNSFGKPESSRMRRKSVSKRKLIFQVPMVRIHFPPAESLSLSRIRFRRSRTPPFARVCAAGLASGSAETRRACRCRANRRQYLCRAIFQYRNAADGVGENATLVPTKTEPSPA